MTCLAYATDNMPLSNVPVAPASLAMELGIVEDTPPNIEPTTNKKPCIRCGCIKKCRCSKKTLRAVAAAEAAWAAAKATGASDAEARSAACDAEADVLMIPGGPSQKAEYYRGYRSAAAAAAKALAAPSGTEDAAADAPPAPSGTEDAAADAPPAPSGCAEDAGADAPAAPSGTETKGTKKNNKKKKKKSSNRLQVRGGSDYFRVIKFCLAKTVCDINHHRFLEAVMVTAIMGRIDHRFLEAAMVITIMGRLAWRNKTQST
jgi:hypothetical protein